MTSLTYQRVRHELDHNEGVEADQNAPLLDNSVLCSDVPSLCVHFGAVDA